MDPISGFVRAVVGDVAFIFGKGMVGAFLLARGKNRSPRPRLDVLVRSPGQYVPLSLPAGTVPVVDRLVGLEEVPAPLLTVEFMPGDTGAEARLGANDPVLITITDVSHREYDALVLTTTLGEAAYAHLPPGYYHVSAVVIDEHDDVLLGYGAQHNLRVDKGDDLIVSLPIHADGVGQIAAVVSGPQPVLVDAEGRVVPLLDLVRIGRASDCDLILDQAGVSRHHAELLKIDAASYEVRDLGSTNGTQVNGVPVQTATVGDADEIRLGSFPLRLYLA